MKLQKIAVFILIVTVLASSANAQLFFPTLVYDPTNYANAVLRYGEMQSMRSWQVQTFWQVVYTVRALQQEYDHLLFMAQQMADKERYRAALTPWRRSEAADRYGTTGPWSKAINRGRSVLEGYRQAIEELSDYGRAIAEIPEAQLRRVMTRYGTVELADAANLHGIELVGSLRDHADAVERAIRLSKTTPFRTMRTTTPRLPF